MRWKKLNCSNFRSHFLNFTFSSMFRTFSCVQLYNGHKKILKKSRILIWTKCNPTLLLPLPIFSGFPLAWKKMRRDQSESQLRCVTLEKAKKCYCCCVGNTYGFIQCSEFRRSQNSLCHIQLKRQNFLAVEKYFI